MVPDALLRVALKTWFPVPAVSVAEVGETVRVGAVPPPPPGQAVSNGIRLMLRSHNKRFIQTSELNHVDEFQVVAS
jgi:hypothetical protein